MATTFLTPKNNAETTLNEALDISETVITMTDASKLGSDGDCPFRFTIEDEIFESVSVSGENITVATRGTIEGTDAATHANGKPVFLNITAGAISEIHTAINTLENAGGGGTVDTSGSPVDNDYAKFTDADTIEGRSYSEVRTDLNIEDGADVTDATNVNAAGAVMESDFNATTFLYATSDNTPQPKTRADVMGILSGQAGADFSMNTHKITGVVDPTANQEAATKKYVDDHSGGGLDNVVEDTTPQLGGDLDLNSHSIDFPTTANISDCLDEDDMASDSATKICTQQSIKKYVDDNAGSLDLTSSQWFIIEDFAHSDWVIATANNGSVQQHFSNMRVATANSENARASAGLPIYDLQRDANCQYDMDCSRDYMLDFLVIPDDSTQDAQAWLTIDYYTQQGDPANKAFGFRLDNLALKGITYDTSLHVVNLNTTLSVGGRYRLRFNFVSGDKIYWYVNDVQKGSSSDIPSGTREYANAIICAVKNPTAAVGSYVVNVLRIVYQREY